MSDSVVRDSPYKQVVSKPTAKRMELDNESAQGNSSNGYAIEELLTHHHMAHVALFCFILSSLILGIPLVWNVLWHLRVSVPRVNKIFSFDTYKLIIDKCRTNEYFCRGRIIKDTE